MARALWARSPRALVLVLLWICATAGGQAFAQPPEIPTFEGEEVVVAGRRAQPVSAAPAYVTVLSGEELRRLGFRTVGEAVQYLAESYVRQTGPGPGGLLQASIRGSSPQQVLVLLDGVPLNATAQLGVNLATLSLFEVERVEVLRGPYSAIWGSGALGGVIHVVTRPTSRLRLRAGYGGAGESLVAVGAGLQGGSATYSLGVEHLASRGFQPNADASRWTGTLHVTSQVTRDSEWTLRLHHTDGRYGLPGATTSFCYPCPDRQSDRRTVLQLVWSQNEEREWSQRVRLWWYADGLDYTSPGYQSSATGSAYRVEWQRVVRLAGGAAFTTGAEWQQSEYTLTSTFGGFGGRAHMGSVFAQYDLLAGERTVLGLGLRYDLHSSYGGQLNPRVGFVHFLTDTLRLRGGLGRTFRGPTFAELFFPGCSNPNLQPEVAWSADLGLEAELQPRLVGRLNGFYTDAQNLIVGGCNPQNVGSARVLGVSAELGGLLAEGWQVLANMTWSDGVDRGSGTRLLRLPGWTANVMLRRELDGRNAFSVLVRYVGERDDLDFSSFPATRVTLPGHLTVGLRYELRFGGLAVSLGVDNLFDAQYETLRGYPAPGRTVFLQVVSGR